MLELWGAGARAGARKVRRRRRIGRAAVGLLGLGSAVGRRKKRGQGRRRGYIRERTFSPGRHHQPGLKALLVPGPVNARD